MPTTSLARALTEFSERSEISAKSRLYYRNSLLGIFLPWAEAQSLSEPAELIPTVVERYALDLEQRSKRNGQPLAVATRRAYLRALRQFLGWLEKRRGIQGVDHKAVPMPRLRRKEREVLSPRETQDLEDAAPIERDKLIIRVMADTGAREGEVAGLRVSDLIERDRRFHFLRLRGKTGERLAPIGASLYRRLLEYANGKQGRPKSSSPALFMAHRRRNGGGYEALTEAGVYGIVKGAAERSGLQQRIYPHLLRHSALTNMVAQGMNIVTVSEITGVSVAVIAQHYSHQSDEERHRAMMKVLGS